MYKMQNAVPKMFWGTLLALGAHLTLDMGLHLASEAMVFEESPLTLDLEPLAREADCLDLEPLLAP